MKYGQAHHGFHNSPYYLLQKKWLIRPLNILVIKNWQLGFLAWLFSCYWTKLWDRYHGCWLLSHFWFFKAKLIFCYLFLCVKTSWDIHSVSQCSFEMVRYIQIWGWVSFFSMAKLLMWIFFFFHSVLSYEHYSLCWFGMLLVQNKVKKSIIFNSLQEQYVNLIFVCFIFL